jgi:hypothetical protein
MHILQRIIPWSCVVLLSFRSLILLFPRYKFIIGLVLTLATVLTPALAAGVPGTADRPYHSPDMYRDFV